MTDAITTGGTGTTTPGRMYWIHALEPLHIGAGRGVGFIDLPILRETATKWPLAPGTSFKGVLADSHRASAGERTKDSKLAMAFGKADDQNSTSGAAQAGKLIFADARLIAFPVRSLYGTFAWVSCPLALTRLHRDLARRGQAANLNPSLVMTPSPANAALTLSVADVAQTKLTAPTSSATSPRQAFLGELDFEVNANADLKDWSDLIARSVFPDVDPQNLGHGMTELRQPQSAWQTLFAERFCLVHDDVFTWLTEFETQVDARVRIGDDTKTVVNGQLWYEESLPPETILAGTVTCDRILPPSDANKKPIATEADLLNDYCSGSRLLQMGGKASVGRGVVQLRFGKEVS